MADLPPYQEYLTSVRWRRRRHARLQMAKGKCERCGAVVRFTDVHHVHYDRLGAERDSDLEVLCRDCHKKHHADESRQQNMGVYILLARETRRLDKPGSATDFEEALRIRCKALQLSTTDHRFDDAVSVVLREEPVSLVSAARRAFVAARPDIPPIGKSEAIALLRQIGVKEVPMRSMPEIAGTGLGVAAIRDRTVARLAAARCPHCQHRGAQLSRARPGLVYCVKCTFRWELPVDAAARSFREDGR